MIVDDFNIESAAVLPAKANAPLFVHANTVLALPVTRQFFKSIAWWGKQVAQVLCIVQIEQLATGYPLNIVGQPVRYLALKNKFRLP